MADKKQENTAPNTEALEARIVELEEALAAANKTSEDTLAQLEEHVGFVKTLEESNAELQAKLEESEKTVEEVKVIVKHEKQRYEVLAPRVQVAGNAYTATELKKLPEVVKTLVEKKSGVLRAI